MSSDATVGGRTWLTDTNAIITVSLVAALPVVIGLVEIAGAGLRFVFLTTLTVGFLPAYVYSKRSRQYSPDRAALWGIGVSVLLLAVLSGIWFAFFDLLGSDGATIVAFLVVTLGTYGTLKVANRRT